MEQIKLRTVWALLLCAFSCVVVFAQASQIVTVTFNPEGGTFDSKAEKIIIEVNSGDSLAGKLPDITREGYVFSKWQTDDGAVFTDKTLVTANITVYAVWDIDYNALFKKHSDLLNDRIGGITANLPGVLFFGVPAGVIILLILLFNLLFLLKDKKENLPELIKNGFEELKSKQDSLQQTVDKNKTEISSKLERAAPIETRHSAPVVQDNSAQYKTTIAQLQQQVAELKATISKLQEDANLSSGIANGSLDAVAEFNRWAANPQAALPKAFYYIEGEMKIREERVLNESASSDSKWITNRSGPQKYLFPNPNSFTQMTVINLLYKITGNLKAKGENKIKITKACDMSTNGFVEFAGELEIL